MRLLITLIFLISVTMAKSQVYSNMVVGKKNEALADSLKHSEYKYLLPILGKKTTKLGYNLPYSAGIGINYLWQQSDIIIENLQVGFNNGTLYDLSDIIRFDKARSTAMGLTIRPDIWLLPFLDIYGIFGVTQASTDVGFGFWVPDSTNVEKEIFSSESKVDFTATSFGFGVTPTMGVGGGWIALDMNFTWTDIPQLNKPAFAFVFGPRVGKTFNLKKPNCSIAIWAGGFRLAINTGTSGSVNLSDVLSTSEISAKIENGFAKIDESQQQINTWWGNLSQAEQNNPVNKAKYDAANKTLAKASQVLTSAEYAVSGISSSTVQYSMDKRPKNKWNIIFGSQFQLNKHWMIRGEFGFLSSRTQFIGGLQYRFGL